MGSWENASLESNLKENKVIIGEIYGLFLPINKD